MRANNLIVALLAICLMSLAYWQMRTNYLIILFLSSCVMSLLYWQVIQPVILRGILFRLFARRDQLRRMAIEQTEDYRSFAYRETESFICKTVAVVPSLSLLSFIWFLIRENDPDRSETDRFHREASPELIRITHQTAEDGMRILGLNSPVVIVIAGLPILYAWIAGKLTFLNRKAENFIDELPNGYDGAPGITQQTA